MPNEANEADKQFRKRRSGAEVTNLAHRHRNPGHDVKTARQMDRTAIKSGELLALATAQSRHLAFQQNVPELQIAVAVLQAKISRIGDLKPLMPGLLA